MTQTIINKQSDIYQYPTEFEGNTGSIAIGDLHGNAVKLINFLLRHDVIKFKDEITDPAKAYDEFVSIYEELEKINQMYMRTSNALGSYKTQLPGLINRFNQFMTQLEVSDRNALVRLIGDEVADRGCNDYITLRLLGFLSKNKVKVHINISNHSNEFISTYEEFLSTNQFKIKGIIGDDQKPSLIGLKLLLDERIVTIEEVTALVETAYKPALKIIDYTLSDKGISLFTHAPVRFDAFESLAIAMHVVYDDSTKEALAMTLDKINTQFQQIVKENRIHEFCNTDGIRDINNMSIAKINVYPLVYFLWNRWNEVKDTSDARPESHNGYYMNFNHGHDPYQSKFNNVCNLDTNSGKVPRNELEDRLNSRGVTQEFRDSFKQYKALDSDEKVLN